MQSTVLDLLNNENAVGFVDVLVQGADHQLVKDAIDQVLLAGDGELEQERAERGIAAAEVVARARGARTNESICDKQIDDWLKTVNTRAIADFAYKASYVVERVCTPPSELLKAWSKSPDFELWKKSLGALKARLGV